MPYRVSIPIEEHVHDYDGDWQRALAGVVYSTNPSAQVDGNRTYASRGSPILSVLLPDVMDPNHIEAETARIGAACDEHIRKARRRASLEAMRAIDAVPGLPDGLPPDEKGELLLEYVRYGTSVDGVDFSMVHVPPGTDLSGANLKGGRFRGGVFERVILEQADLRGAELRHCRAAGARLGRALLHEADLRHTDLRDGDLQGAQLHRARADHVRLVSADLSEADLRGADLRDAYLQAAKLDGAYLPGVLLNAETCRRARWSDEIVVALRRDHSVRLESLDEFPAEVRRSLVGGGDGLTLTFGARMHRFASSAVEGLILEVLGPETDVGVEEQSRPDFEGAGYVRINGSHLNDLLLVAEAFYAEVWRCYGTDTVVTRLLTDLRPSLKGAAVIHPDVQETLLDQAAEHLAEKDRNEHLHGRWERLVHAIKEDTLDRARNVIGERTFDALTDAGSGILKDVWEWWDQRQTLIWARRELAIEELETIGLHEDRQRKGES